MKIVTDIAVVAAAKCSGCGTCVKVCPVVAIRLEQAEKGRKAVIDGDLCQGCNICVSRCPLDALVLEKRTLPLTVGYETVEVTPRIEEICTKSHMYPDQIVCFCHRTKAKEIAAAIVDGAKTPEDVTRMTGARCGCGVLCITGIIRLLKGAGIELDKAPGNQWYGKMMTVWDLPETVMEKYGEQYYLKSDQDFANTVYPGGKEK